MTFKKVREQKIYGCIICRREQNFEGYPAERAYVNLRSHEVFCGEHKSDRCVPILIQEEA